MTMNEQELFDAMYESLKEVRFILSMSTIEHMKQEPWAKRVLSVLSKIEAIEPTHL